MPSIYIALDGNRDPLYVGRTRRSVVRLEEHFSNSEWWRSASSVELVHLANDTVAAALETLLIYELKPPFNKTRARPRPEARELLRAVLEAEHPEDVTLPARRFNPLTNL